VRPERRVSLASALLRACLVGLARRHDAKMQLLTVAFSLSLQLRPGGGGGRPDGGLPERNGDLGGPPH